MSSPVLHSSASPTKPVLGSREDDVAVFNMCEALTALGNITTIKGSYSDTKAVLGPWGSRTARAYQWHKDLDELEDPAWADMSEAGIFGQPPISNPYHADPFSTRMFVGEESIRKAIEEFLVSYLRRAVAEQSPWRLSSTTRPELVKRCLSDLDEDAGQQEIEIDSEVRSEVERILLTLNNLPDDVSVVADEGGAAEIEVFNAPHGGFVLRCEPGGGALCVVSVDRFNRRARYQDSQMLPDGFVERGLTDVLQRG